MLVRIVIGAVSFADRWTFHDAVKMAHANAAAGAARIGHQGQLGGWGLVGRRPLSDKAPRDHGKSAAIKCYQSTPENR